VSTRGEGTRAERGGAERGGAERGTLSLGAALLPVGTMLLVLLGSLPFMALTGELIVVAMLCAAAVAGVVAARQGASWDDVQRAAGEKVASVLPALLILLSIGMLIALWMLSGTIPFLVSWGVRLVSPQHLVVTAFLATALMSTFTGTSWGSAGTIGVAMMGTAAALGAPLPMVAGAIVSGAYFGDKMSPLSDSTILAAVSAESDVYAHIRHMLYTAGPSFAVSLLVYATLGQTALGGDGSLPESGRVILRDINAVYSLSWLTLLPPLVVVACIVRRVPSAIAIVLSSAVAAVLGLTVQGFSMRDVVVAAVAGFKLPMITSTGADVAALSEPFAQLVQRGGLNAMSTTLVLVFAAFLLAAAMEVSGALDLLISRLLRAVRSTFALIAATMTAGATMIGLTSHGGVTMLVVGGLFQQAYRDRGLAPQNLSRSLEDSVTITEPLMPWTVSAVFMATTLGVPTVAYAPWAVFCYLGPVFSLAIAAAYARTGFGIRRLEPATIA
jgi:Na+:H+ antiporter, NhaC family